MSLDLEFLGAVTTFIIYLLSILVFIFRVSGKLNSARRAGIGILLMAIPLTYLLITAPGEQRQPLYYIQIGFMLLWMLVTLLVDYIYEAAFRDNLRWVIVYVILFFAGTGGMLGVSSLAGQTWITVNGILFLVMAVMAFVQRAKTGY
jgi:hypothetical protein